MLVTNNKFGVRKQNTTRSAVVSLIKVIFLEVVFAGPGDAWAELAPATAIDGWFLNVTYSGYQ
ncbi:unnamed protein product [marine sediment metagenome]|uniref:Uncharacterized protein n=1 Tax=marine sediment metagenome TaxID=412755 RepID=X1CCY3_9ZZZZ